ncbi:hypothetical protein ACJX0J_007365 [Zea mays]
MASMKRGAIYDDEDLGLIMMNGFLIMLAHIILKNGGDDDGMIHTLTDYSASGGVLKQQIYMYSDVTITGTIAIVSDAIDISKLVDILWQMRLGHMSDLGMAERWISADWVEGKGSAHFWAKAASTTCYSINRSPSIALNNKTPIEVFGCTAYAHDDHMFQDAAIPDLQSVKGGQIPGIGYNDTAFLHREEFCFQIEEVPLWFEAVPEEVVQEHHLTTEIRSFSLFICHCLSQSQDYREDTTMHLSLLQVKIEVRYITTKKLEDNYQHVLKEI